MNKRSGEGGESEGVGRKERGSGEGRWESEGVGRWEREGESKRA